MKKFLKGTRGMITLCIVMAFSSFAFAAESVNHESVPYQSYLQNKLEISGDGVENQITYMVKELEAMAEGKFKGIFTMRTLVEPHSDTYEGIALEYLLTQAKIKPDAKSIQIVCGDGLSMKFSVEEIIGKTYLNEVDETPLKVILAYGKSEKPLVESKTSQGYDKNVGNDGGPLRLMIGQNVKEERNSPKCLQNVVKINVSSKEAGTQFSDLGNFYSWAEDAIYSLTEKGILSGIGDGKFSPEGSVSRAQFAKMITLAYGIGPITPTGIFSDVPKEEWYAGFVEAAAEKGLIQGTGGDQFNPEGIITRNDIAVLMVRAMELESQAKAFSGNIEAFNDEAKIPDWARGSVAIAAEKGLFDNIAVSYFNGNAEIKRAEAAVIIDRALKDK